MIKKLNEVEVEAVTGANGSYVAPAFGFFDWWPFRRPSGEPEPPPAMNG